MLNVVRKAEQKLVSDTGLDKVEFSENLGLQ